MNTWNKALALLMGATLTLSLLAGCGQVAGDASTGSDVTQPQDTQSSEVVNSTADVDDREEVELVWYVAGSGPQADLPAVMDEVNAYLKEKINATLKIVETDFGNYDQKMQMVIAGQEEFDLCYTAHWSNNFYNNVNKNAFLELDALIDQYAPELKTQMPPNGWDASKVNGNIMAVPNQQIWAMTNGLAVETEYLEKYSFDMGAVQSLKDIEPLLQSIKEDNPNMFPLAHYQLGALDFLTFNMGYDELAGRHIPGVVMLEDGELKVINQFELPQVKEHYELMHDWNKKGYFRQDAATITDLTADYQAGKHPVQFVGTIKPGGETGETITHGGRTVKDFPISESWLTTSGITATMTAISRTSKHPERAMEFLNLFNTDPVLYNLITQGIEGKHYEKIDEDYIKPIENSGYYPNADWMYGNQFLAYFKEGQSTSDWGDTIKMNETAKASPALGFAFDATPVQTEIAGVSAVVKEYQLALDTGSADPSTTLPEFLAKLENAGSQAIVDEVQKQLDAWKATR